MHLPASPNALIPLGLLLGLLLVGGVAAIIHFLSQSRPAPPWRKSLTYLAQHSPWTLIDLAWILLCVTAAQLLSYFFLPPSALWSFLSLHGVLILGLLWRARDKSAPFGRRLSWPSALGQSLLRWLAVLPILWFTAFVWHVLLNALGRAPELQQSIQFFIHTDTWNRIILLIIAVIIAPIAEECLFRGILLPLLARRFGPWTGLIISSLAFAVLHNDLGTLPALFIMAIALSLACIRTRSLLVPILMHMIFNAVNLALLHLLLRAGLLT